MGSMTAPTNEVRLSCRASRRSLISFMVSLEMSFFLENFNSFTRTRILLYWAVWAKTCGPHRDSNEVALFMLSWNIRHVKVDTFSLGRNRLIDTNEKNKSEPPNERLNWSSLGVCKFSWGAFDSAKNPQAPTPQAPVRNCQTRKVANAKVRIG